MSLSCGDCLEFTGIVGFQKLDNPLYGGLRGLVVSRSTGILDSPILSCYYRYNYITLLSKNQVFLLSCGENCSIFGQPTRLNMNLYASVPTAASTPSKQLAATQLIKPLIITAV